MNKAQKKKRCAEVSLLSPLRLNRPLDESFRQEKDQKLGNQSLRSSPVFRKKRKKVKFLRNFLC